MTSSKTRSKKEESPEQPPLIPSLPEDIILDILARVRSCYYPTISLVSKHFRSLVASHALHERRSLLGCTEHRLHVVLYNTQNHKHQLYVLRRKANGKHRLVLIPSLPRLRFGGSFLAVGSSIYVFDKLNSVQPRRISIDCSSQKVRLIPGTNVTMSVSFAYFMDGKIYVNGYRNKPSKRVMAVFNIETQTWEPEKELPDTVRGYRWTAECVVMAGKMYTRDPVQSIVHVYDPKENKWGTDQMLDMFDWENASVVDDVLYYYDDSRGGKVLRAYDPKESSWVVVNGLEELLAEVLFSDWSYTGSYGGKLALFFYKDRGTITRCAQISLERRHQGSEIWGKIDWCDDVLVGGDFYVRETLDVIV